MRGQPAPGIWRSFRLTSRSGRLIFSHVAGNLNFSNGHISMIPYTLERRMAKDNVSFCAASLFGHSFGKAAADFATEGISAPMRLGECDP